MLACTFVGSPDTVRRVMWEPGGSDAASLATQLRSLGAREWQIELTAPMLAEAVAGAGEGPAPSAG